MARDWRKDELRVDEPLAVGEWYRSPLWDQDHCLGRLPEFLKDELAWCGRSLGAAYDWDNDQLGGLWFTNRVGNKCAECKRRDTEFLATQ